MQNPTCEPLQCNEPPRNPDQALLLTLIPQVSNGASSMVSSPQGHYLPGVSEAAAGLPTNVKFKGSEIETCCPISPQIQAAVVADLSKRNLVVKALLVYHNFSSLVHKTISVDCDLIHTFAGLDSSVELGIKLDSAMIRSRHWSKNNYQGQ